MQVIAIVIGIVIVTVIVSSCVLGSRTGIALPARGRGSEPLLECLCEFFWGLRPPSSTVT